MKKIKMVELFKASNLIQTPHEFFYPTQEKFIGYRLGENECNDQIVFRPHELSIWTGFSGHGKSQFLGQVMLGMINQGARICIASFELKPTLLLQRLVRQTTGMRLPSQEHIIEVMQWFEDKLWIFDLTGMKKVSQLIEVFTYARQQYGVDTFVIDSFAQLGISYNDHKGQKILLNALCDFKNEYDCQLHMIVPAMEDFDESKPPSRLAHKGTGVAADIADNCFSVWRNKGKEFIFQKQQEGLSLDDNEQEKLKDLDCILLCDKQRNGSWEGSLGFWFDKASYQYLPYRDHFSTLKFM